MPEIELMQWDSQVLGLRAGRAHGSIPPAPAAMDKFDMVLARLPINDDAQLARYQNGGFQFVALDLQLSAHELSYGPAAPQKNYSVIWHSRQSPVFKIAGFSIEDSRLMRDPRCREHLAPDFWDRVITEHCSEYADMVACALDATSNCLLGFISCFLHGSALELFLVAVHPDHQGRGIGHALLQHVETKAAENGWSLTTQVLASNVKAMNFYIRHGFRPTDGELVLHRWKNGS